MGLTGRVLITGGAGFLARGIYRRARAELWPAEFTCLSRDDAKHHRLQLQYPEVQTVVGDVATMDRGHLADTMRGFDLVIHAAASKYVDRAEREAIATIEANVWGSVNVTLAAHRAHVPRAIAISTDKACQPVNTYGATKLLMERIWQEMAGKSDTDFVGVRYGNVVGSTGSVLTLFEDQLREEGFIKLTDPTMTRFWMSVDEAIDAILAAVDAPSGAFVIPKMRASTMADVVLCALGADERGPLPEERVRIVGVRPGEKMHEQIIHRQESVRVEATTGFHDPWLLHPPGIGLLPPTEPFEVTSADPPLGTIPIPDLRAMVADAAEV